MNNDLKKILRDLRKNKETPVGIQLNLGDDGAMRLKGEPGYTPQKGVDYWTREEINEMVETIFKAAKPNYGIDYYTDSDKRKFVAEVLKMATPVKGVHYRDGIDGKDGKDGKDAEEIDARKVAIDAINFLETFEGDARLSAKALKDLEEAIEEVLEERGEVELSEKQINSIKDLLPKYPPQNAGGSGATFLKSLRDVDLSGLTKNADGKYVLGGGSGASTFLGLTDTPSAYTGQASKVVAVNATEDGLEFTTVSAGGLTDGDKGDITVSASGATWTIDTNVVTNAKAAQMATKTYKGRTSAGTGNAEDVPVATLKTDLVLVKGDVGLGNVDNTSDANKPISTATQTALDLKEDESNKGIAGGYASLDGSGKVPSTQLPALALTDVFTVASQVAQLALTAEEGDVAIRTDQNKSYIHNGGVAGTMADWSELLTPTDTVLSVNGEVGAVTLTTDDISDAAQTNKWSTAAEKTKLGHIAVTQAVDLDAIEAASHAAVTVTDSTSIDITLTGQDITAQREALTGAITAPKNSNTTSLGSFTIAQLNTAVSDADLSQTGHTHTLANITDVTMTVANLNSLDDGVDSTLHFHATDRDRANHTGTQAASTISDFTETAQDAVGAMVATSIVYNDAGATLQRAALTGAITASQDSNTTALGSFTKAQLDTAVSDGNVLYVGDVTTNATHTGEVTGSGALAVDKTAISNRTDTVITASDYILFGDASDTDNLKKDTVQGILDLVSGGSTTVNVTQTAHGLSAGNLIRSNGTDNQYAVADKDAGNTADAIGYVTAVTDANNFTFQPLGHRITNNVPVGAAGSGLFVGDSGALTTTEPTTVGMISKPVGIITASGSSMVMFNMRGLEVTADASGLITALDATAHRLFYSDGAGNVSELAFGSSGTYLKSNGSTSAPSFDTPAGGSADYAMYTYIGGFY